MIRVLVSVGIATLFIPLTGCKQESKNAQAKPGIAAVTTSVSDEAEAQVAKLIQTEDLVLDLNFRLRSIGRWIEQNTSLLKDNPSENGPAEFSTLSDTTPLLEMNFPVRANSSIVFASSFDWPVGELISNDEITNAVPQNPLRPLLGRLSNVTSLKFGVVSASLEPDDSDKFTMNTKLTGKGNTGKETVGFVGTQTLNWKKRSGEWQLVNWHSHTMKVYQSSRNIFQDVTEEAIPDPAERTFAQRSYHGEFIDNVIQTGKMPAFGKYTSFVDAASPHALPSVSAVDVDADGWDDLFISARWGKTQLLRNNHDGTFTNQAKELGLEFPNLVNCSVFIDLDNDGDKDAILGRSLEPVIYLRNDSGKFTNVTESLSNLGEHYMVSAISVSDINRDGLLDLYFSTYGPFGTNEPGRFTESADWRDEFLTSREKQTLQAKHRAGHGFVDNAGPPNFIAMNRGGGKLEVVVGDELVSQWHHSYQTAWADADGDGDDDLYVTNDFAQDGFLINETPAGADQPKFSDGLETFFPNGGVGFGMGASWGDFDADGDLDLYVSNMYSKAGARIIDQLGAGDPRMEIATRGNFLYENREGIFENQTGTEAGRHDVGRVGWSYGGQFIDVDNNGFLDLYVPCGYFTASTNADTEVDI